MATNQDWWLEADEFFYLNLYKNPGDVSYASSGSAFIKDSPVTSYNYTISSSGGAGTPVTEGGAVTFTITRSGSGAASSVYLSTEAGSAGGNDFSGLNKFELSFAAYETSKTVTVNTHTDGLVEGDEYFWLDLYRNFADSSYAAYSAAYIQDMAVTTDYSYQVTSNAEDVAVTEGSVVTFTITRSGSGSASTVYWGTEAGTASAGAGDYQSLGISTLNFAAYETSKTVTVNTYADAQAEGEEYFWLNLYPTYADATNFDYAAYGFAYINDPALAVTNYDYTITSNATYAAPVSEGGSVTFTITRNGSGSAVSVYVSTSAGSAGAGDFQGLNTTELKFSAFETSKTVTVNTYTDFLTEGREYFWLDLYKSYADVGNDLWSSYGAAYLNDPAVAVTNYSYSVTSNAEDVAVTEGGVVTFTITRSGSGTASTVYWDTEDGTASAATGDYQAVGLSTLSFAANEVSKTVTVQTYSDAQTENYEYFWLNVYPTYADASNFNWADYGTAFVADPTVVATDYNYTIVSSAEDTAVTEGGTVTFTILRDGTGSASTVYVSTSDGTTDAHDFQALGLSMLTFAANEVSKTVTVKTYADTQTEYLEWFWLDLYKTYADALNDNYASYGAAYLKDFGTGAAATGLSVGKPASVAATASKVAVAGAPTAAASSAVSQSFPGHSLNEFNNDFAFAALKANGAVVAWGQSANGGDLGSVASALNGDVDVTHIYASNAAFAAVRLDGSVVSWGNASAGGDSSAVAAALNGTVDVVQVFSTATAFAALLRDGSVVSWGDPANGGDSAAVAAKLNGTTDVSTVYSNLNAFAAVRSDGSVVSWGFDLFGGNSSAVAAQLSGAIDVTQVVPTGSAFAALRADGSVVSWGSSGDGGDSSAVASQINGNIDVLALCAGSSAFAALRADGSVVSWGDVNYGGDSSAVADKLNGSNDVTALASTLSAFAALRADGSVVTWGSADGGGNSSAVASALNGTIDVTHIVANGSAFAALRADGSVVSWGYGAYGGDQSAVAGQLDGSVDVLSVAANEQAFAALRADGSVVTWGSLLAGGDSSAVKAQLDGTVDVSQLYASSAAFAALRIDGTVVTWGNLDKGGDSSGVAASLNSARNLTGDLSNAWIVSSDPTIYGTDGRDRLNSTAAAETIDGLAGIDTVVYGGNRASFTLARSGSGFTVTGASGAAGTDTLLNVERLEFADKKLAIDLEPSGHAGQAVEFLGLLVPGMVNTPSVVGLILGLFDQGQTMHEVCQLALDAGLVNSIAGSASNQALAALVFRNLTGSEADAATIDVLVSYIDGRSASFSQADFMAT
ncbi:MAG: hypothetical protein JZU64_17625, partial [Rhodoferax sp.]|nr:hypothetical protein [Rhodoferax sp.]